MLLIYFYTIRLWLINHNINSLYTFVHFQVMQFVIFTQTASWTFHSFSCNVCLSWWKSLSDFSVYPSARTRSFSSLFCHIKIGGQLQKSEETFQPEGSCQCLSICLCFCLYIIPTPSTWRRPVSHLSTAIYSFSNCKYFLISQYLYYSYYPHTSKG